MGHGTHGRLTPVLEDLVLFSGQGTVEVNGPRLLVRRLGHGHGVGPPGPVRQGERGVGSLPHHLPGKGCVPLPVFSAHDAAPHFRNLSIFSVRCSPIHFDPVGMICQDGHIV